MSALSHPTRAKDSPLQGDASIAERHARPAKGTPGKVNPRIDASAASRFETCDETGRCTHRAGHRCKVCLSEHQTCLNYQVIRRPSQQPTLFNAKPSISNQVQVLPFGTDMKSPLYSGQLFSCSRRLPVCKTRHFSGLRLRA